MKAEELMKPRFEVIADYPLSPYFKGDVIIFKNGETDHITTISYLDEFGLQVDQAQLVPCVTFEKYPHLFRKLNWWEHRSIEDMPKKVLSKADDKGSVFEIHKWDMERFIGWLDDKEYSCCSLYTFKPEYGYFPVD